MKKDEQVNAAALSMRTMIDGLSKAYDAMVGRGQHEVILLVGAGDVVQFAANTPRERSVLMLRDLLARWSVGLPDTLPGEIASGDTRAFEYLLNEFEQAAKHPEPATQDYGAKRAEVLGYVGRLLALANRGTAA